jgi:hypothetical protein
MMLNPGRREEITKHKVLLWSDEGQIVSCEENLLVEILE